MITKEYIEKKLEIVHRQMKHCGYDEYYLKSLLEEEEKFFSDKVELYPEAIRQIGGLICNDRAWDDMVNASEKYFIEEFRNYDAFWDFTFDLMKDINEYNETRLRNR